MNKFALSAALFAFSIHTFAATIDVTTTNDVLDAGDCSVFTITDLTGNPGTDGFISLREAVCAANNTPGADEINLSAGIYDLSLGGSEEDANLEGDLDITETLTIRGIDSAATMISNAIGDPFILGDGDRLIEVAESPGIDLFLERLSVRNGDVGCTGEDCRTGAGAIHYQSDATLSLIRTAVVDNQSSCSGICCGNASNAAAIAMISVGTLITNESAISNNRGSCTTPDPKAACTIGSGSCVAGVSTLIVSDSNDTTAPFNWNANDLVMDGNISECDFQECDSSKMIHISGSDYQADMDWTAVQITNNINRCTGNDCDSEELFQADIPGIRNFDQLIMDSNQLFCEGNACDTDNLFSHVTSSDPIVLTVNNSRFTNNVINCIGDDCGSDELFISDEQGDKTIKNTIFADNMLGCTGFDCGSDELVELCCGAENTVMKNVQILRNTMLCNGESCDVDETLDVGSNLTLSTTLLENVVVADNVSGCTGLNCTCDTAGIHFRGDSGMGELRNSTITGNQSFGDDTATMNNTCRNRSTGGVRIADGDLRIVNTTIHNNQSVASGGGILNATGNVVLDHVTITNNIADSNNNGIGVGGGICNNLEVNGEDLCGTQEGGSGTITLSNTIVAGNENVAPDCFGIIDSDGFNIVEDTSNCQLFGGFVSADPLLEPLADNGCSSFLPDGSCVPTRVPQENSPAVDAGSCATSGESDDQRGFFRPSDVSGIPNADDGCDIGAVELNTDLIFANGFEH